MDRVVNTIKLLNPDIVSLEWLLCGNLIFPIHTNKSHYGNTLWIGMSTVRLPGFKVDEQPLLMEEDMLMDKSRNFWQKWSAYGVQLLHVGFQMNKTWVNELLVDSA